MGRQAAVVLYVLALVAVVVGVDVLFFRHHFSERLIGKHRNCLDIYGILSEVSEALMSAARNAAGPRVPDGSVPSPPRQEY